MENDYIFMETSCFKNENVADAFETLIEITNIEAKKNKSNTPNNNIQLNNEQNETSTGCRC